MRSLQAHSQLIEVDLTQSTAKVAFAFGAAICQRIWPAFVAGLSRNKRRDAAELERLLTAIWKFLADLDDRPASVAEIFEKEIPSDEVANGDNEYFWSATLLYGFAQSFENGRPAEMLFVSDGVMSLLDNVVYKLLRIEPGSANDLVVDSHPLIAREMMRQVRDLAELSKDSGQKTLFAVWKRSQGEQILDTKSDTP